MHQAVRFSFPQRHAIALIVSLMLSVATINALEPLVLKALFDELTTGKGGQILILSLAALTFFAVMRELMEGTANWVTWRTRIGLQYALLEATIGKLHKMPLRSSAVRGSARS